jgi:DNA-binding NtrC family response regulator
VLEVLIVDDDVDTCDFLKDFLASEGHNGHIIRDPSRVLGLLQRQQFHAILLDIMMPGVSGISLLQQIRAQDRDISVVILTGYPEVDTAIASIQLSVAGYLKKPFSSEELRGILLAIAKKRGLSQNREERLCADVGQAVRLARKDKEMTLKDLAARTNLSVSLLSQIERGEGNPTVLNLFRISQALDISLADVFREY